MTPEEAKKFLEENEVKFILAQFVDIHGVAKTKSVPASCLMDVVDKGAGFAGFAVWGLGMEPQSPDFMARGDLNTLSLVPWQPGYARIVCTGYVNDETYALDSRQVLMRQLERTAARGWTVQTGLEPEFSLLKRNDKGKIVVAEESDRLGKACYDYKGLSRSRHFLEKFVGCLQELDYDVYQIDHEDANGQFEINYTYSDALTSCDRFIMVRMAGGEIANDLGMICSFMPKPFADRAGNGMHIHVSITDEEGNNVFGDESDKHGMGLSKMAYHFTAGLLHHAGALCAFSAPTVNSYKRLVVGNSISGATWAPAYISYGDNNRSAMVRVPHGRLEYRLADGGCNPYLVHAALIAAGLDGIERELEAGEPRNINHYSQTPEELAEMGVGILPQNLSEALTALEQDSLFSDALGQGLVDEFIKIKRMEWTEYQLQVSDWELEHYVEFF